MTNLVQDTNPVSNFHQATDRAWRDGVQAVGQAIIEHRGIINSGYEKNILTGETSEFVGHLVRRGKDGWSALERITHLHNHKGAISVQVVPPPETFPSVIKDFYYKSLEKTFTSVLDAEMGGVCFDGFAEV